MQPERAGDVRPCGGRCYHVASVRTLVRPQISAFTIGLIAVLSIDVSILALTRMIEHGPWYDTFGWSLRYFLRFRQGADSWRPMETALTFIQSTPSGALYEELFFQRHIKFQYPPSSLLLVWGLTRLQLKAISAAFLVANIILIWHIAEMSLHHHRHPAATTGRGDRVLRAGAIVGLLLTCTPLTVAFAAGQIQTWINSMFALSVWLWLRTRDSSSGAAVGLMTWIKPNYALFAVWAFLRKRRRLAASALAVAVMGVVAGIVTFGITNELDYFRVLSVLSRHGEAFVPNQSINGVLHRVLGNGNSLRFQASAFPPFHPVVYGGTLVGLVTMLAFALWYPTRRGAAGTPADFALFTIVTTVTAPIAWEHHYGVIVAAIAAAIVPFVQATSTCGIVIFAFGWLLMAPRIEPLAWVTESPWNIVQSYRLVGAMIMAGMLTRQISRSGSFRPTDADRCVAAMETRTLRRADQITRSIPPRASSTENGCGGLDSHFGNPIAKKPSERCGILGGRALL